MRKIIIGIALLTFALSFNVVDGFDVVENSVVIKFSDNFAPKLGSESPIELKQLKSIAQLVDQLSVTEFKTLFLNTTDFGESEYKHSLHHYYVLKFEQGLDFNRIKNDLESINEIDLIEPIFIKKANLSPNDDYYPN